MQLSQLGLDRFLYKNNGTIPNVQNDVGAISDSGQGSNAGASEATSSGSQPGNGVQPGSPPIQSTLLQSSGGPDRVEINPDDDFYAYNNNVVVVQINKNGITATEIDIITENVQELNVTDKFTYDGVLQPVMFTGIVDSTGAAVSLPPGWSSVRNSAGSYTITHNLNTIIPYMVTFSPITGHYRCKQGSRTANSFDVDWEQTNYGSDTFPVSGGGGGTVTVDGIRVAPDEVPVDTDFQFIFAQNLA